MKRFAAVVSALVLALTAASVFGHDHIGPTVSVAEPRPNAAFLVDRRGRVMYYFAPYGMAPTPLEEDWPATARMWVGFWQPVLVSSPEALIIDESVPGGHVFEAVPLVRQGRTVYQVYWGGERTGNEPYWALYTSAEDEPVMNYEMVPTDRSPGWVSPIWEPAVAGGAGAPPPANPRRATVEPGEGVGNNQDGGP